MVIGVLLLAVVAWCAWWHVRENRQLIYQWRASLDNATAQSLARLVWSRSIQLLAALGACTLVIVIYDWQLRDARTQLAGTTAQPVAQTQAQAQPQRIPINRQPVNGRKFLAPNPAVAALPTAPVNTAVNAAANNNNYYPPSSYPTTNAAAVNPPQPVASSQGLPPINVPTLQTNMQATTTANPSAATAVPVPPDTSGITNASSQPALPVTFNNEQSPSVNMGAVNSVMASQVTPIPLTPGIGAAVLPATEGAGVPQAPSVVTNPVKTVEDVYNPEETTSGNQAAMDGLKKRYEDILVTYFFLKQCGMVNPNDYHVITSALSQDMASINAPGRLQNDILTAAQGSYKEIYAHSSCQGPTVSSLYTQYNSYIASIAKTYGSH